MTIAQIALHDDMATLTFPQMLLEKMGILVDDQIQIDQIQIDVVEQTLIARAATESERVEKITDAVDHVFHKYDDVFTALAEGAK